MVTEFVFSKNDVKHTHNCPDFHLILASS